MLYQTFPCNPFSPKFSSPTLSSQVDKEMECIAPKQSQMMVLEDICSNFSFTPQSNAATIPTPSSVSCDDFCVDELLNLNHEEYDHKYEDVCQENDHKFEFIVVKEEQYQLDNQTHNSPPLDSVLSVPAEEADLEWLSHFVEDSFSQFSTPYPSGFAKPKPSNKTGLTFTPAKARRSKRARTGGRVWSARLSDPPSPSTTAPPSPEPKKQKKRGIGPSVGGGPFSSSPRCSHCGVHKTPQWRAGPMGAKTLCNACGVRYKSGRLLPEYRPACSPTFSKELHSNSHRKVLEMRKKKEVVVTG
ncbi:GATA transcription factor 7 [Bienertia sinuspersici]